eukprot:362841-Lingulodinium_polyedra.AAC.1
MPGRCQVFDEHGVESGGDVQRDDQQREAPLGNLPKHRSQEAHNVSTLPAQTEARQGWREAAK